MDEVVRNFLINNHIDLDGKHVCVAVSTGVDSSVLLHILQNLSKEFNFKIVVCHVNHGKREQSIIEEEYLKEYSIKNDLIFEVEHFKDEMFLNKNFQSEARNLRIAFFKRIALKYNTKYIFLAHHLKDDIETSIMHILRGGSINSYSGMNPITKYKDIIILRPLLTVLKEDIYEYARINKIKYFEDYTNNEDHYSRNRIRHDIIPILFEENKNFKDSFLLFKEQINSLSELKDKLRDDYIKEFVKKENKEIIIDINSFNKLDHYSFMKKDVLFEVLKKYYLSSAQIKEIIKIIESNKPNIKTTIDKLFITKEYDKLIITENDNIENEEIDIKINDLGIYNINDKYTLEVIPFSIEDYKKNKNLLTNSNIIWYNSSKFPFVLRNRRNGDKITVGNGTKKVKDLLIDEKIPLGLRDKLMLLTKDEEVLAIFNLKKSSKVLCSKNNDILFILKEKKNEFNK